MAPVQLNMQQIMLDQAVDMALAMTAQMFGLPKPTVAQIIQVGLPMMAQMVATSPELLRRMYAIVMVTMPEPVEDFYDRMAANTAVRQAAMDDYKAAFGSIFDAVNRTAAQQAGTTAGQAREVIAAVLPAVGQVLKRATEGSDHAALAMTLQRMAE